ncbi:hypothetical protein SAMN05444172_2565 [Burkholderia sp. GAS332]|nr:hypothetical protein SAMN05444172_2565 [Burkholderia sp. GAS332]
MIKISTIVCALIGALVLAACVWESPNTTFSTSIGGYAAAAKAASAAAASCAQPSQ